MRESVEQGAHTRGLDDASPPARAGGASNARDVGAALAHDRQVVSSKLPRERDGQRLSMRPLHPRRKRRGRQQFRETRAPFVCCVQQNARSPGGRCYIQERRGRHAFVQAIRVGDEHDAPAAAADRKSVV